LISFSLFEKLGEFPLVEGSFQNLRFCLLSTKISSFDNKFHFCDDVVSFFYMLDREEMISFSSRNQSRIENEKKRFGYLNKG